MARALKRILEHGEQPEVLDLGQFSRSAAIYLASRGARVCIEDFEPPPPTPRLKLGATSVDKPPISIPHADGKFDLVLGWEHMDFVPPDRVADFAAELSRVMKPGGWLVLFAEDRPGEKAPRQDPPACYRLTADDRIVRTATTSRERLRWAHPNRAIERGVSPMKVQSIQLQRNRIREFLVQKPEAAS
jgi:SAM-dependent methyltransferase